MRQAATLDFAAQSQDGGPLWLPRARYQSRSLSIIFIFQFAFDNSTGDLQLGQLRDHPCSTSSYPPPLLFLPTYLPAAYRPWSAKLILRRTRLWSTPVARYRWCNEGDTYVLVQESSNKSSSASSSSTIFSNSGGSGSEASACAICFCSFFSPGRLISAISTRRHSALRDVQHKRKKHTSLSNYPQRPLDPAPPGPPTPAARWAGVWTAPWYCCRCCVPVRSL